MESKNAWVYYSLLVVLFCGVWGAFIDLPEKNGFPATLGYVVWAFTMIPAAMIALSKKKWKFQKDKSTIIYGIICGLMGAAGQLILFIALRYAPAYLIFPLISLTPLVPVVLAVLFLKEKCSWLGWTGIALSLVAGYFLSYSDANGDGASGSLWLILSILVMLTWGIQSYVLKVANQESDAESIFFYMTVGALALVPFALLLTDFSAPINWGMDGAFLAACVQILNAFGALFIVYSFRYGKAIFVAPISTAMPPVVTIIISLILHQTIPHFIILIGMILAIVSAIMMVIDESKNSN